MSSLFRRENGKFTIQVSHNRRRHSIRLNVSGKSQAKEIQRHVDRICDSIAAGVSADVASLSWVSRQSPEMRNRLAKIGLIDRRQLLITVGDLLDSLRESNQSLEQKTARNYEWAFVYLERFFGRDGRLASITPGDADDFARSLRNQDLKRGDGSRKLSPSSVSTLLSSAKIVFNRAVKTESIFRNPFADIKTPTPRNESNFFFVDRETYDAVFENLDSGFPTEHKLTFAFARWGGVRAPSETRSLEWDYVDFDNQKIRIWGQKTKKFRSIPIFPEMVEPLEAMRGETFDRQFVFPATRAHSKSFFYEALSAAIKKAGLKLWPRLVQNLRATRSNEIEREFGAKIEAAWIGHDSKIAAENYFSVSDSDFAKAANPVSKLSQIISDRSVLRSELSLLTDEARDILLNELKEFVFT